MRPTLITAALLALAAPLVAQPPKTTRADSTVPDGLARLGSTLGGGTFVAAPLKAKYDGLLARLDALKRDLDAGRVAPADAATELATLRVSLKELRDQLDRSKVVIPAVEIHTRVSSIEFELSPDRAVVVTADRVRVVGCDGDKLRCTLEKVYLGGTPAEADAQLAAVEVVRQRGPRPELVGRTTTETTAAEAAFLASPAGRKLTPAELAKRGEFVAEIDASRARFRDFQGKQLDSIRVGGLDGGEGNAQMRIEQLTKGGDGVVSSPWRRHATLTVHLPKCRSVLVRGGLGGLDVSGVEAASVVITSEGGRDRDYDATHRVKGVRGDVAAFDFPLHAVEAVTGNLRIECVGDFANSSGASTEAGRVLAWGRALPCAVKGVGGEFVAHFGRADLRVEAVAGRVAVENDAGDTHWHAAAPLSSAAHRVGSLSGAVELVLAPGALGDLPLVAATGHGTLRTDAAPGEFAEFQVGGAPPEARGWFGVHRAGARRKPGAEALAAESLRAGNDSPGVALRSLAGSVTLTVGAKAAK